MESFLLASKSASKQMLPDTGASSNLQSDLVSSRSAGNKAVTPRKPTFITAKQRHLVELFANPLDKRDKEVKAAEVGISYVTAWRWQQESWWASELLKRQMAYVRALFTKAIGMAELLLDYGEEESKCKMVNSIFKAAGAFPKDGINISQVTGVTNTNIGFREAVRQYRAERRLAPLTD